MYRLLLLLPPLLLLAGEAAARTRLITLPVREQVAVQLDRQGSALVEEERRVPLSAGDNPLEFSWANTRIDPETIVLRIVGTEGPAGMEARLLSVSYPPAENALVWALHATHAGAARVRISYLLGGLDKQFHYRTLTARDERTLTLEQYLRVDNGSGEGFDAAGVWPGFGERTHKDLKTAESKELLFQRAEGLPLRKRYSCDPVDHGFLDRPQNKLNVPLHYVLGNDTAHGLGQTPLPAGKVRMFQEDGKGGSAFIGEDRGAHTPIGEELALYVGLAQDVVVRRTVERSEKSRTAGELYQHEVVLKYEIENFKEQPVTLDIVEHPRAVRDEIRGYSPRAVEWASGGETTVGAPDEQRSDLERQVFHVELPGRGAEPTARKVVHKLHLLLKNEW